MLRPAESRREETEEMSRVKPAKTLMLRWEPITSERITSPLGGPEDGGPSCPSFVGSWMPGFMIASCRPFAKRAGVGLDWKGRTRSALLVTIRLEARMALEGFIVGIAQVK